MPKAKSHRNESNVSHLPQQQAALLAQSETIGELIGSLYQMAK